MHARRPMKNLLRPLARAARVFRQNPAFAISALCILTLGIGANTAIFSVVNAVLLHPLPFADSDSIVSIYHVPPAVAFPGLKSFSVSLANYLDWRKQNDVFESMSAFGPRALQLRGGNRPHAFIATISDSGFFEVLRAKPAIGRVFREAECQPGHDGVIVLSDAFARSQFGSPANAFAKQLDLDGRKYRVI